MTTQHEEEPEPALATAVQRDAEAFVKNVALIAMANGWEFVLVSVSRRIDVADGRTMAPGATAMELNEQRMGPALFSEATALRTMANNIEKIAAPYRDVATAGYVQDRSDYASGGKDWPR